jgi:hypothetical protein
LLALPSSWQQLSLALQRNERIALLASAASGKVHLRSDDDAAAAAAAAETDASKSEPSLSAQELMVCLTTNICTQQPPRRNSFAVAGERPEYFSAKKTRVRSRRGAFPVFLFFRSRDTSFVAGG